MSIEITPLAEGDDGYPRMVAPDLSPRVQADVTQAVAQGLEDHADLGRASKIRHVGEIVESFFGLYRQRPVTDNQGGSHFNDSLWIYVLARLLDPKLIVESGVFKGHTTWLLRQACPDAQIHCFDVDLGRLVYEDSGARYHQGDWSEVDLKATVGEEALIFFDDHISHARRICEAHKRGFRRLLLDDNFAAETLYATGAPPVPTLAMLMDRTLEIGTDVAWQRKGKEYRYRFAGSDIDLARSKIDQTLQVPDLAPITRYNLGSGLTLVDLKS